MWFFRGFLWNSGNSFSGLGHHGGCNPCLLYTSTLKDWRAHTGVDFAAKAGDEVKSISSGTVTNVYQDDLLGKVIVVDHSGIEAYYCGMDEVSVQKLSLIHIWRQL